VSTRFFRFITVHAIVTGRQTDRQMDGQKGLRNTVRCITCSRPVQISYI